MDTQLKNIVNYFSRPEQRQPTRTKIAQQNKDNTPKYSVHQNKDSHQNIDSPLDLASSWFTTLANICITTLATLKPY